MNYEEDKEQKELEKLEQLGKSCLSKEALIRYGTLKSAHPGRAIEVITYLSKMIQMNKIQEKINDNEFKAILKSFDQNKKEFNIKKF